MVKNHLRDIVGLPRMWVRGRTLQSSARERKEEKIVTIGVVGVSQHTLKAESYSLPWTREMAQWQSLHGMGQAQDCPSTEKTKRDRKQREG